MDNNTISLAQDKVLILYLLNNISRDVTESDLFKLISPINNINYFYFKQILSDLVDSKLIGTYTKDEENNSSVYEITSDGKHSLELTVDVLPGLIKLKADTNLKPMLDNIENEHSIIAEFTPKSEDNYIVNCKIMENNETVFEIKTFAGSRDEAKKIVDNWKNNAEFIYPKLLETLTQSNLHVNGDGSN